MKFAIVGAGLAGAVIGSHLHEAGFHVRLFDKGRGPGGRLSTRRVPYRDCDIGFDHGATGFAVTHAAFQQQMARWQAEGIVSQWPGPHYALDAPGAPARQIATALYVAQPKMNALVRHLLAPLEVNWHGRVIGISRQDQSWQLRFEGSDESAEFDGLILALPSEQARALCAGMEIADRDPVWPEHPSQPCWSAMFVPQEDVSPDWSSLHVQSGAIARISRETSKPGREGPLRFVVQAHADWSQTHLEKSPEEIVSLLKPHFAALTGFRQLAYSQAHRWRFAQAGLSQALEPIWHERIGFGLCGDWLLPHHGVEAAWLSAVQMHNKIIEKI